jgi:hypothetical protein
MRYRYSVFTDSSLRFEEGGLWSDLVPSTRIVHSFLNGDNAVVLADERAHHGITDFCARMVCEISSTSNGRRGVVISYIIMLFPAGAAELEDTPESKQPGWPGIGVIEGPFPLGPKPTTAWRCPVLPFIRTATPFSEVPAAPSSNRLRAAIGAVMRKVGVPDVRPTGAAAVARWALIRTNPRKLLTQRPDTSWPAAELPADQGEYNSAYNVIYNIPG